MRRPFLSRIISLEPLETRSMLSAAVMQAAPAVSRPSLIGPVTKAVAASAILTSARAIGTHLVQVTLNSVVDKSTGESASKYAFASQPSGTATTIKSASLAADGKSALLTVSGLNSGTYKLYFNGQKTKAVSFAGTKSAEAYITSAKAISNTQVVLTFSKALADAAADFKRYSLGTGNPAVTAAVPSDGNKTITLTTAPQSTKSYTVTVLPVVAGVATGIDPTKASKSFAGIGIPTVSAATATSNHFVKVTFSDPVGANGDSVNGYTLTSPAGASTTIDAVTVSSDRKSAVLQTTAQARGTYTIGLKNQATKSFTGSTVAEAYLTSAKATSNTQIVLTFSKAMASDATNLKYYAFGEEGPNVSKVTLSSDKKTVTFTTASQWVTAYSVTVAELKSSDGVVMDPTKTASVEFMGVSRPVASDGVAPKVVGAVSTGNTKVLVSFSEMMDATAVVSQHYSIVRKDGSRDMGSLPVLAAKFTDPSQKTIELTTASQSQATYGLTVVNVRDGSGSVMASPTPTSGGVYDPTKASFAGTPPIVTTRVDTDGDKLTDDVEVRGWAVTVIDIDGTKNTRIVTSDPNVADTDGDGLNDYQEANIRTDPRSADSDDDQLDDYAEFNEIYSNPLAQDTDGDTLDDFLEFGFFKTSPIQGDTDGDQLRDDYEVANNRNPRVSDLPRPEISVGSVNLQLNVQFTETNDQQKRDLETKTVSSTLAQSADQSFSKSDTWNVEAHLDLGTKDGSDVDGFYFRGGYSGGFTSTSTNESAASTQAAYENSLSTDKEVTRGFTVQRNVAGATMQVAISLRNLSSLAYRVKNLQVTAFIQDPQDHSKLTPVATLLPDAEPSDGFTLGPLTADKGPLIFSNASIVPSLVESLMANSSGLIFRISNYDIVDEKDRNFAFTGQEIVERTARMVIDYGGASSLRALLGGKAFDELKPGDETEIFRVATSAGRVIDTNGDGAINDDDHAATFGPDGKEVGITLFEALHAAGLTQYKEADNPTGGLTQTQVLGSFSTYLAPAETVDGVKYPAREKIFRIRGISNDAINKKYWEVLSPQGIDQAIDVKNLILKTDAPVSLNFVQDLDKDGLSADVEYFLRTSDSPLPVGAVVPGTTDFKTNMSVLFSTDPDFGTGGVVRVSETGGGLTAGQNYYARAVGGGAYGFYETSATALAGGAEGRVKLTGKITAGLYIAALPIPVAGQDTIIVLSGVRTATGSYPTGTVVQTTDTGGGLEAGKNYFLRDVGTGGYSFYNTAQEATAAANVTSGVITIDGEAMGGIFSPTAKGRDTDGDGLDDRFEALIGWNVITPNRTYQAYSSPNRADSNFDAPAPDADSDGDGVLDLVEYSGTDLYAAPAGWEDKPQDTDNDGVVDAEPNGLRDRFEIFQLPAVEGKVDYVLDPLRKDTDNDGIDDGTELIGFKITPITGEKPYFVETFPTTPYTDSDTFTDGLERALGLNPKDGNDTDKDGDGLPDTIEARGWTVYNFAVSGEGYVQGAYVPDFESTLRAGHTDTEANILIFTDEDDPKIARYALVKVNGGTLADTAPHNKNGDPDTRYFLGKLVDQPDPRVTQYGLYAKASDAAAGISSGMLDLTDDTHYISLANESRKPSRTNAVDSDADGLTDYEEFFLGTNPSSSDSDGDGIADRLELLGYTLGHDVNGKNLGIIKTDPLDADTDNDKLSDGTEAELVEIEKNRWIVRVAGQTPYRVYSNPLIADADFDGLVDGDERAVDPAVADAYKNRTDPFKGNTDNDKRTDDVEIAAGTNPLAEDVQVTVIAQQFTNTASKYAYQLDIGKPDPAGTAGLSKTLTNVDKGETADPGRVGTVKISTRDQAFLADFFFYYHDDAANKFVSTYDRRYTNVPTGKDISINPASQGVPVGAEFYLWISAQAGDTISNNQTLVFDGSKTVATFKSSGTTIKTPGFSGPLSDFQGFEGGNGDVKLTGSKTFGLTTGGNFSIEGSFRNISNGQFIALGGLTGAFAKQTDGTSGSTKEVRPIFSYTDVASKFIQDYFFEFKMDDGSTAKLKFFFIIS